MSDEVPVKRKVGAPKGTGSKKTPERVKGILTLAKQGKTMEEIADIVRVSVRTLHMWQANDWEFAAALKENKDLADDVMEASLYKAGLGYEFREEAVTKEGVVELAKWQPPSVTAQIFWLKNRRPGKWRDRVETVGQPATQILVLSGTDEKKLIR